MKGLLTVERMVLESVAMGNEKISVISKDTKLSEMFVRTILSNLKEHGLVLYRNGKVSLNKNNQNLVAFNQTQNVKHEVKDLFNSLVENYFFDKEPEQILKMQKIWLTDLEFKILKSMMDNIQSYIVSIRKDRLLNPEEEVLAEQRVIFWGADSYTNLINTTMKAA